VICAMWIVDAGFQVCSLFCQNCYVNFCGCRMTVESVLANLSLVLHRDHATFGAVSVFCYAQSIKNGATQNEDFIFAPQVMIKNILMLLD
jgi:hypothetical protein